MSAPRKPHRAATHATRNARAPHRTIAVFWKGRSSFAERRVASFYPSRKATRSQWRDTKLQRSFMATAHLGRKKHTALPWFIRPPAFVRAAGRLRWPEPGVGPTSRPPPIHRPPLPKIPSPSSDHALPANRPPSTPPPSAPLPPLHPPAPPRPRTRRSTR